MNVIHRSELVWIRITGGTSAKGAFFPFPDIPSLNGVMVTGFETMNSDTLVSTPDGLDVLTPGDQVSVLMTFNEGSDQRHKQLPNVQLDPQQMFGIWKEVVPFKVDWQKSGCEFTTNATVDIFAVPILVHYYYPEDVQ